MESNSVRRSYRGSTRAQTSGEIIEDAKRSLNPLLRQLPLSTRRPETPLEEGRRLFQQTNASRPPSTFSLGSHHFDSESRPSSGVRLTPLTAEQKTRNLSTDTDVRINPRPPTDPNRVVRRVNSRTRIQPLSCIDVDAISEPTIGRRRSESLKDVSDLKSELTPSSSAEKLDESSRRVQSGPKERTQKHAAEDNNSFESLPIQDQPITAGKIRNDHKVKVTHEERTTFDDSPGTFTDGSVDYYKSERTRKGYESKGRPDDIQTNNNSATEYDSTDHRYDGIRSKLNDSITVSATRGAGEGQDGAYAGAKSTRSRKGSLGGRVGSAEQPHRTTADAVDSSDREAYYEATIAPVLEQMTALAQGKKVEKLTEVSSLLYELLKKGNLLGRSCRQRSTILKCIYQLLDLESPQLLLNLARLILALKVTGKNLLNVCKLIFAVSKESQNDNLFLQDNILDLLVETAQSVGVEHLSSSSDSHQTLVYCLGSLKFLSSNASLVKFLASKSHLSSFAQIFKSVNQTSRVSRSMSNYVDILVQLAATLRNVANVSGNKQYFLSFGLVEEICCVLTMSVADQELMYNVSGLLSKLTLHANCCDVVSQNEVNFKSFLELLVKFKTREDIILRVMFILGNLLAKQENARTYLVKQPNALNELLGIFQYYFEQDLAMQTNEEKSDVSAETASRTQKKFEDVVVKTVRVIANASISQEIGEMIAKSDRCMELLLRVLEEKQLDSSEELILNVMATINNLSFYNVPNSAIVKKRLPTAQALLNFLEVKHKEGLAEATRVFGNLTREKDVRDFLVTNKVDEAMVAMLDSGNRELVFAACGVLINLMADEDKRPLLYREGGISKLIGVLQEFGRTDWQLAAMVCQTLWNFSAKITSSASCFGEGEAQEIIDILTEYLDDENISEAIELEEIRDYLMDTWKTEFSPVALDLLRRVVENQSHLEPLTTSS